MTFPLRRTKKLLITWSLVRSQPGQPFDARCDAPLAHGLRPAYHEEMSALIAEVRRMALSKRKRPASKGARVVYLLRLRSNTLTSKLSRLFPMRDPAKLN
jgi:hypothetical protein